MEKNKNIKNEIQMRTIYESPEGMAVKKVLPKMDKHLSLLITLSPFLVLSTVRADGYCDASPRGDAPGFVRILDDNNLFLPDRPGNNRLDSLTNILAIQELAFYL